MRLKVEKNHRQEQPLTFNLTNPVFADNLNLCKKFPVLNVIFLLLPEAK